MSPVVDVTVIGDFGSATLCFDTDTGKTSDSCLAYYDTKKEMWICQDKCLRKNSNNQICGETDHFTSFAILLGGGIGDCTDDSYAYVTGSFGGDLILVGCVAGLVCVVCFIFLIISFTPPGKRLIFGEEGLRVVNLRSNMDESAVVIIHNDN